MGKFHEGMFYCSDDKPQQNKPGTYDFDRIEIPEDFLFQCIKVLKFDYLIVSIILFFISSEYKKIKIKKHYNLEYGLCNLIEKENFKYFYGKKEHEFVRVESIDILNFIIKYKQQLIGDFYKKISVWDSITNFYWFKIGDLKSRLKLLNNVIECYKATRK